MKYHLILIGFIFGTFSLAGQSVQTSVISPTGSSFSQSNFGLHFSVGEPLNTYIKSENGTIAQGLLQMPGTNSSSNNQAIGVAPNITCPQETVVNICAPVGSPAALGFDDFNPVDDQTAAANIDFAIEDAVETQAELTTILRKYIFTDGDGNSTSCEVIYHIANQFIEAPAIAEQKPICAEDLFAGVKIGNANYRVYADENGSMGSLINTCDEPGYLLCSASDLDVNVDVAGNNQLWVTEFINFPDGSVCESAASALKLEVIEKPTAQLSQPTIDIQSESVINLMEFVEVNKNGYWTGEGVFSVVTADGSPLWLFSGNTTGATKVYYTVSNQICTESYLLVVNVEDSNTCDSNTGTFFYADCGGISYYFIELEDGRIFDPYFAIDPGYFPSEGQQIRFDYEIKTDVSTPCNISESPITITCFETITPGNFANKPVPINNSNVLVSSLVQLYPNPVVDYLNLNVADVFEHNYSMQLYNMQGAMVKEASIKQPVQSVDMKNLDAGNYILHLIKNNQSIDFFKVVKQ